MCLFLDDHVPVLRYEDLLEEKIFENILSNKFLDQIKFLNIVQYYKIEYEYISGISIYLETLENYEGVLNLKISNGQDFREKSIPNYKVKNGWNFISFEPMPSNLKNDLIFYLSSDVDFFKFFYYENKNNLQVLKINNIVKKAVIKHKLYGKLSKK
jgi:hypothetical protein